MPFIVLFHSMLGLRSVELQAAQRLRRHGHEVVTPDLYEGRTATSFDEGFRLMREIGWAVITQRARRSVQPLPADAVLSGLSMGVGVVGTLLPERGQTAGVLMLHALADIPDTARPGLPLQVHVGALDVEFAPPASVATWRDSASRRGAQAHVFTYPNAGHFYTDASLPDHDEHASELTWQRIEDFLHSLQAHER
jgi:dienelactone hydrolase